MALLTSSSAFAAFKSIDHLGRYRIGMTVRDAQRASDGPLPIEYPNDPSCGSAENLLFIHGKLAVITVADAGTKTPEGIGDGSSIAAIQRAYPTAQQSVNVYSDAPEFTVYDTARDVGYRFFTTHGRVEGWQLGRRPALDYAEGCL